MLLVMNRKRVVLFFLKIGVLLLLLWLAWPLIQDVTRNEEPVIFERESTCDIGKAVRQERTRHTAFDSALDQFVLSVQDFYYEEQD